MRIELGDFESGSSYATYGGFAVGSESEGYVMKVLGGYHGDAGKTFI